MQILIYIIIIFIFIQAFVVTINFFTPRITNNKISHNDLVSILIPARNEEKNISNLLNSIINQDYSNYEIIVLDDHSEDNTYKIVEAYCYKDSRFKIIKGKDLPEKWKGKNWACHQLSKESKGDYLLYLDADTQIKSGLINSCLNQMKENNFDLLSIFPKQITISIAEKLTVPIINYILLSLLPLILVEKLKLTSLSAANGQFMLFKSSSYKLNNWHEAVKESIVDDIDIMKAVKSSKLKGSVKLSNALVECRMYDNFDSVKEGMSKNIILIFGNNILGNVRLKIVDAEKGKQPFFNEEKTVCVVLNGEIFNYKK
ncbi:MAG: glycosyltransferase, partial [Candidatus Sericytochromatia bacterium]